jgi:hypothetical protein
MAFLHFSILKVDSFFRVYVTYVNVLKSVLGAKIKKNKKNLRFAVRLGLDALLEWEKLGVKRFACIDRRKKTTLKH